MLRLGRCRARVSIRTLMMIDSLDMTDADRALIVEQCRDGGRDRASSSRTAPTRWWKPRARWLARFRDGWQDDRPDRRDGAVRVRQLGRLFNLGSALSFVQVLPPGVYIAMNGRCFTWDRVRKNGKPGVREP